MTANREIASLLSGRRKAAPHYAYGLSAIGEGSMHNGITRLARAYHAAGKRKGIRQGRWEGAVVTAVAGCALWAIQRANQRKQAREAAQRQPSCKEKTESLSS